MAKSVSVIAAYIMMFFGVLCCASLAFADGCDTLDSNRVWVNHFEKLQDHALKGEYDAALEAAQVLFEICPRSPAANYYTAMAFQGKGDHIKATQFYQKASEYTSEFAVAPEMSRRIWYARYESEYPERSAEGFAAKELELKEAGDALKSQESQIADRDAEIDRIKKEAYAEFSLRDLDAHEKYGMLMWSGVGIGIAGVAMTVAGSLFAFNVFDFDLYEDVTGNEHTDQRKYEIRNFYRAGWALFGAGIALTVAGAVMTGIGGYQYTHPKNAFTFSMNISPVSASLSMTF